MKVVGSIMMYSGIEDPEMELSEDVSRIICNKLFNMKNTCPTGIQSQLGFRGYSVLWTDEDPLNPRFPSTYIHVYKGKVDVNCFGTILHFEDTENLEAYLAEVLQPCLDKHYEDLLRVPQ